MRLIDNGAWVDRGACCSLAMIKLIPVGAKGGDREKGGGKEMVRAVELDENAIGIHANGDFA